MKAVILAGGLGKRLRPLTNHVPKAMLPLHGRPIIDLIIKNLRSAEINNFIIVTCYLGEQIRQHLGEEDITFVEQEEPLGSGDALRSAISLLKGDFVVTASDTLLPVDHIRKLIDLHLEKDCDATLSLKRLSDKEIVNSSTVLLREDSIVKIIEKPSREEILSNISACPFYIFNDRIKDYLPRIKKSKRGEYELTSAIQLMIDDGLRVKGLLTREWFHLSNMEDFLKVNLSYPDWI